VPWPDPALPAWFLQRRWQAAPSAEADMSKSPGHRKWPEHNVREKHLEQRIRVRANGQIVAESHDVIKVDEDGQPARYYFPRTDVSMTMLERSNTTTECPFKGKARYFSLIVGDRKLGDAAWSYEDPYEEHLALKDRLAFHDDKMEEIDISPKP
jgi:uncharacterized protein (DUF427 family)